MKLHIRNCDYSTVWRQWVEELEVIMWTEGDEEAHLAEMIGVCAWPECLCHKSM